MTTRLEGAHTTFLPFNQGDNGAAGNPPNERGHRTAYLWETVWARDSWLEILGRYLVAIGGQNGRSDQAGVGMSIFIAIVSIKPMYCVTSTAPNDNRK